MEHIYSESNAPVDGTVRVYVPPDGMQAFVTVSPALNGGKPVTFEQVMQALRAAGVVEGIRPAAINEALNSTNWNKLIPVAEGTPAADGEDARLVYHFPLPETRLKPKELEDGKVDFRSLNLVFNVRRADVLVTRIPAKPGKPGITVTGRLIPPKGGKHIVIPRGKNTVLDDTGNILYAGRDGHVAIEAGKVAVFPVLEVNGDVDYSVGNIDFVGDVLVRGNILTGFTVKAVGDIEVRGLVEAATVEAGCNVLVRRGIVGAGRGKVKAGGTVASRFIEHATVEAGQDVLVGNSIVHSVVRADRAVRLERNKSTIIGGLVQAGEEISCAIIGSVLEIPTTLEVGVLPQIRQQYDLVVRAYQQREKEQNILGEQLESMLRYLNTLQDRASNRRKAIAYNLQEQYRSLEAELQQLIKQKTELDTIIGRSQKGKVTAAKIVYPGVTISINRDTYKVSSPIQFVIFHFKEGRVQFDALR